ncbi:MAG: ATP-binding protein [Chlamydiia bacterium]|nr:ATP-binding protein [Chlamydiia bacterium]
MLIRNKSKAIEKWFNSTNRRVLHVRGMRQVGKTTIVINFLQTVEKDNYVILNMSHKEDKELFESGQLTIKNYKDIIFQHTQRHVDDNTVIFIDEIQRSIDAYAFIKQYKDHRTHIDKPVNLIVSGSYVDTTVSINKEFPIPVGCIKSITLRPLSFYEFLNNMEGGSTLLKVVENSVLKNTKIINRTHTTLMKYVETYMLIGGMPQVVNNHINKGFVLFNSNDLANFNLIIEPLHQIVESQLSDIQRNHFKDKSMGKIYSKKITNIYRTIVNGYRSNVAKGNINQGQNITKFMYKDLEGTSPSTRDYEEMITHLRQGNIITMVHSNKASNLKNFKLIYSDMGLLCINYGSKEYFELVTGEGNNKGYIYEQFVGGEILAYGNEFDRLKY